MVAVHSLAQRVLGDIRRGAFVAAGDRVGVAVSGGIDSIALLRLLLELRGELGIVLSVVHFNHKLRGAESEGDQEFVAGLAGEHGLEFYGECDDVARIAAEKHISIEAAARKLRYGFFRKLLAGRAQFPRLAKEARPFDCAQGRRGAPQPDASSATQGTTEVVPFPTPENSSAACKGASFQRLDRIATGHTLDDQAETVLMRMIRGAGLRGLGGIYPRIVEDDGGEVCGEIVRPLLGIRRRDLELYLKDIGQSWREDSSNADAAITRNRVRRLVLPLIEKELNPAATESLAELAAIARGEEEFWENEVAGWMGTVVHWAEPEWARAAADAGLVQIATSAVPSGEELTSRTWDARETGHAAQEQGSEPDARFVRREKRDASRGSARSLAAQRTLAQDDNDVDPSTNLKSRIESAPWLVMNASVDRLWFLSEPVAVRRRLVKAVGQQAGIALEFKHVEQILRFAEEDGAESKEVSLPRGWKVARRANELAFVTPDLRAQNLRVRAEPEDYEYELVASGQIVIVEAGVALEARRLPAGDAAKCDRDHLLDAAALRGPLRVRNWRRGERFWPGHAKSPRKIKELLQERHIALPERRLWPVAVSGEEIVWLRGFPVPAKFRARPGREAILIAERPLDATAVT